MQCFNRRASYNHEWVLVLATQLGLIRSGSHNEVNLTHQMECFIYIYFTFPSGGKLRNDVWEGVGAWKKVGWEVTAGASCLSPSEHAQLDFLTTSGASEQRRKLPVGSFLLSPLIGWVVFRSAENKWDGSFSRWISDFSLESRCSIILVDVRIQAA